MVLLVVFAFFAGAVTAVTPCVLPVLPAIVSASATGGRRRPAGVVTGLSVTFFVTIVGFAKLVDGVGLADGTTRTVAIVVLVLFGIAIALPPLGHRIEELLAPLSRLGPRRAGDGFWSGLGVGGALGFVFAPCAGPILAAVISVSAAQEATGEIVAVAAAYALGSAATLLVLALGGRRLFAGVRRTARGAVLQRAFGVVMIATAVALVADLDVRFQTALANDLPSVISNPTHGIESSDAVEDRLRDLRGSPKFDAANSPARGENVPSGLPHLGPAPEIVGTQRWFNTPGGRALTLQQLRGRVVLIDFWTYTCINCIRTLPYLRALDERYRRTGLTVVGVHTPEFAFEHDAGNVADAIAQNKLRYPVAQDNDYATWQAFGNQFWPAHYLIDAGGQVRYTHFGEGRYRETEDAVRALLREAGGREVRRRADARIERSARAVRTPETYIGYEQAQGWLEPPRPGRHTYPGAGHRLALNQFALGGRWQIEQQFASAVHRARIDATVKAKKVFLVLGSRDGRPRSVRVALDGRPVGRDEGGADVRGSAVTVRAHRLYRLVSLPRVAQRRLTLTLDPGVSAYAFTFG
jgi:cytochrome c biogenesis protein CcdA/thiol-disulfide isomerase/thioredoxin